MKSRGAPDPVPILAAVFSTRLREDLAHLEDQSPRGVDLASVRSAIDQTAGELAEEVRAWVEILAPDVAAAMLARPRIAAGWRLPWAATSIDAPVRKVNGRLIWGAAVVSELSPSNGDAPRSWHAWARLAEKRPAGTAWPARATSSEVGAWISTRLRDACPPRAFEFAAERSQDPTGAHLPWVGRIPPAASGLNPINAALIFDVHQEIGEGRKRPTFPVEAGEPHQKMLASWANSPKHLKRGDDQPVAFPTTGPGRVTRLELFDPKGRPRVQLALEIDSPNEALILAIKDILRSEFHSYDGLRSWAAILSMCGHDARTTWTLGGHMEAMQLPPEQRTIKRKKALAKLVAFLLRLELRGEVIEERASREGRMMLAEPLFELSTRLYREGLEGEDLLEAISFRLNPRIFGGVRTEDGEIGTNWWPTPVALPTLTARDDGPALALGLQLPIAFQLWIREQRNKDANPAAPLIREGAKMLRLAGIDGKHPWDRLHRALDTLVKIEILGSWCWRDGAPSRSGMLELRVAAWALDRTIYGVRSERLLGGIAAPTGSELRRWRERSRRTQAVLARELGVSLRTLVTIEGRAESRVKPDLAARLRGLGMTAPELDGLDP
jgi:DNA-binding XRE family transcriptional regulator